MLTLDMVDAMVELAKESPAIQPINGRYILKMGSEGYWIPVNWNELSDVDKAIVLLRLDESVQSSTRVG